MVVFKKERNMKEYEYSFKVKSIAPYIDYCKNRDYEEIEIVKQNRKVYENRNSDHIIARLTTEEKNGERVTIFDCKNVGEKIKSLNISNESLPMQVREGDLEIIKSILNVLEFVEAANNFRTRYVYQKGGVKFEIDDYTSPKMKVVAIEGDESEVEAVYKEIMSMETK